MNLPIFLAAIFFLQLICLYVSTRVTRSIATQEDYFLAGKGITFFPLLMTFIATQIGGGLVLGASEEAYKYGWYVLLYPLGCSLGFILLAFVGKKMYRFKISTVAQIYDVVYKSTKLKKIASSLSIVSLFMIFLGQLIASKKFMLSLGFDQDVIFIGFWSIVIAYTVMGGLQAVVATDIIQALFFIGVFLFTFIYVMCTNAISFDSLMVGTPSETFIFDSDKFCGWLLMPLLFMIIEQDMGQRCFAAKSGKVVAWASICSAICVMIVCSIPIYLGILGRASGIEAANGASILMTISSAATNPVLAALMGCAVLCAIVSTADALINSVCSNLVQDFEFAILKKNMFIPRALTAALAFGGVLASYLFNNVVDLLILSYELSISCLFVSVFMAMVRGKGFRSAASASIALGAFGFILFRIYPIGIPKEIASLLLSAGGYVSVSLWENWKAKNGQKWAEQLDME